MSALKAMKEGTKLAEEWEGVGGGGVGDYGGGVEAEMEEVERGGAEGKGDGSGESDEGELRPLPGRQRQSSGLAEQAG